MLGRTHRFHGHNSLTYVYRHGSVVRTASLLLKYHPNSKRTSYRVAVVVSKKVSKKASTRNRIRRRIYEAVRMSDQAKFDVYDLVFVVHDEQLAIIGPRELQKTVAGLLKKAKLIGQAPKHGIVEEKE